MKIKLNSPAPDFTLPDQDGKQHSLSDYKGKWVLVYFYPKDDTPGCTKEACTIRDNWSEFEENNIIVLGISKDSVASHTKFAQKYELPFTILSDEDKEVIQMYGVWTEKSMFGKKYMGVKRSSFLINPEGKIAKIYKTVKPAEHAGQVIQDINLAI